MGMSSNAQVPSDAIARALADLDAAESCRFTGRRPPPKPKLKPLVLQMVPNANVRRTAAAQFECFIGDQRVHVRGCDRGHTTPDRAWICLARYVTSLAFGAGAEVAR
jgi:hypothetical protein